jgi:hypothetical protein
VRQSKPTNLYEASRQNVWDSFSEHLSGSPVGAFLIVSSAPLAEVAQTALLNSSATLGYGASNTAFLTLWPDQAGESEGEGEGKGKFDNADPVCSGSHTSEEPGEKVVTKTNNQASTESGEGSGAESAESKQPLAPQEIFRIIESLDPLCIVIADHQAIEDVARAFRARLEIEVPTTLLGHYCCCFEDFKAMLSRDKTKQKAWSLLKAFPKRS